MLRSDVAVVFCMVPVTAWSWLKAVCHQGWPENNLGMLRLVLVDHQCSSGPAVDQLKAFTKGVTCHLVVCHPGSYSI